MPLQQISVVLLCVFLLSYPTSAVVNNGNSVVSADGNSNSNTNTASPAADSASASSEKDINRRELPVSGLSDSYGVPLPSKTYGVPFDTYGPPVPSNPGLPVPVYGVPNGPSKNVVYPAPPPDIPPPLPSLPSLNLPQIYGPPKPVYGPPKPVYGPPKPVYGPPKPVYGPPIKLHPPTHHKPQFHKPIFTSSFSHNSFQTSRPSYGPPPPVFIPKPQYGPPLKPVYGPPKFPKPIYGPPLKLNFAPQKPLFVSPKPVHGPIKLTGTFGGSLATYGPPHSISALPPTYGPPNVGPLFNPPKNVYGPPQGLLHHVSPAPVYGPPQPVPHGPPHPGAPAPPTPPDIKYDGWQPILGLVSHAPSNVYGAPHQEHQFGNGIGLIPPLTYASSFAHGSTGSISGISQTSSDSYGAPLNTVTGSGGIVSSSGNDHTSFNHGSVDASLGNIFNGHDNSLSVIKSIGYEIFPSGGGAGGSAPLDTYGAPPADSFSPNGPYAAALVQKNNGGIGLIPPSGMYGVPPGGQYGAPLLSPPKNIQIPLDSYGPPVALNALDINPPKSPVVFREPVPQGLLQSIGESVAHKDAQGIQHSQTKFQGDAYIPPPVPDITKSNDINNVPVNPPSNLYSLPNTGSPISFQSITHGSGSSGFGTDFKANTFNLDGDHGTQSTLTSYTAPLGIIDSSYGIPLQSQSLTAGFDQSFDFSKSNFGTTYANTYSIPQISLQSTLPLPHDCSQHSSQPITSYGLPSGSASSYASSISSLNTNIGGQSHYQFPSFNYENSNTQSINSLQNSVAIPSDVPNNSLDIQGKSLGQQYFGKDAELQQSQEIHIHNGVQNIPVQGSLGSYTLQIQSANGFNGQSENIPHEQVLSEGLLQSILSAIEQPEPKLQLQHQPNIQSYGDLQNVPSNAVVSHQQISQISDGEAQHSVARQVVITPPSVEQSNSTPRSVETTTSHSGSEAEQALSLIDNNEIALYFNNHENQEAQAQASASQNENNDQSSQEVRNGQQYGSFVSFKTPHSSYVYGELKTNNQTQSISEQTH